VNCRHCAVLTGVTGIELLVIDGYVDLAPDGKPGLGACVHAELGVPVVGVAKTFFATATHAMPVLRGNATRPLYVTAAGMPAAEAAELIRQMSGRFRLPDALREVDALARGRKATLPAYSSQTTGQHSSASNSNHAVTSQHQESSLTRTPNDFSIAARSAARSVPRCPLIARKPGS